ncbi:hypothetical protein CVS40_11757 [Lucilia cuprina]|nr:hypothetical protein CVS40_11757 [Lucilia cuprina]
MTASITTATTINTLDELFAAYGVQCPIPLRNKRSGNAFYKPTAKKDHNYSLRQYRNANATTGEASAKLFMETPTKVTEKQYMKRPELLSIRITLTTRLCHLHYSIEYEGKHFRRYIDQIRSTGVHAPEAQSELRWRKSIHLGSENFTPISICRDTVYTRRIEQLGVNICIKHHLLNIAGAANYAPR